MATSTLGLTKPTGAASKNVEQLLQHAHRNDVYLQTVKSDPYLGNKDLIKPMEVGDKEVMVKSAMDTFFVNVTPKNTGSRSVTLGFVEALDMDPTEGQGTIIGSEGDIDMKWTKIQANDWSGGIVNPKFGIDYRELYKQYGLNEISPRLLMQWRAEVLGYYVRESLVQGKSHNLTASPISETQGYNMNWYVPSLSAANQPDYDSTASDHANAIGDAVVAAGASAIVTIPRYLDMIEVLQDGYLEPVMIGGKPRWVQYIAPRQLRKLKDATETGSWAAYWQNVAAVKDIKDVIPQGDWIVDDKLILIEDRKAPTMTVTGSASARTLSFGYDKAGRKTTRTSNLYTSGDTYYCDLSPICGAGALMWYEPEKVHKEKQADEHNKYESMGLFGAVGFYSPKWDVDTDSATDSTALQESSWIMATIRS